jgi:hypothetical protein
MTLKKKKVARNALQINSEKLPPQTLTVKFRPEKMDELKVKKGMLQSFDMQIDPGLESEELEKMMDIDYEKEDLEKKNEELFGESSSDEDEAYF